MQYEEYVEIDKQYILKKFTDRIEQDNVFDFIVKPISDGELIGVVYIWKYGLNRKSWEIGYVILPKYLRQRVLFRKRKVIIIICF